METAKKAFISYKWENEDVKKWVERFATDLRQNGVDALLDIWEVSYGESFIQYMTSKIPSADIFLFVVTPGSASSIESQGNAGGAVKFEVQMALAQSIAGENFRFIPVLYKGDDIPKHLRAIHYVDFRDTSNYQAIFTTLLDSIRGTSKKPPLLGVGHLQYDTRLYEMLPAVKGSPVRSIMARFEPFVGFPFYSYESDHPSRWPLRVDEDRQEHAKKIIAFMEEHQQAIDIVLSQSQSSIKTFSSRVRSKREEREAELVQQYTKLRMLCNGDLSGDEEKIRSLLGDTVSEAFYDLERDWEVINDTMPNRLFTLGVAHDRDVLLEDVTLTLSIVGDIYDIMLDDTRPVTRDQIDKLWVARKFTLSLGNIPPASTLLLRIFYNYMPLDQRWDAKPVHIMAEPTQGILLQSLGAKGVGLQKINALVEDEGVYKPFTINLTFPEG
jgi:hypothetical protein